MTLNRLVITVIVCYGIYACYCYLVHRINLANYGRVVQGKVIHIENHNNYFYIQLTYQVNGKEYFKTSRISKASNLIPGATVSLRVLPDAPENAVFEFDSEALNKEVYLFLSILLGYCIIRMFVFLGSLSRPNW